MPRVHVSTSDYNKYVRAEYKSHPGSYITTLLTQSFLLMKQLSVTLEEANLLTHPAVMFQRP